MPNGHQQGKQLYVPQVSESNAAGHPANHPPQQENLAQSRHQCGHMPAVVTTSDEDKNFDIDNVSSSSNEGDQTLDRQVCLVPSNDMNEPIAPDLLLNMTRLGGRTAATYDVNYFFDCSKKLPSIRKFCHMQFAVIFMIGIQKISMLNTQVAQYSIRRIQQQELKSLVNRGVNLMNLPPHPITPTPNLSSSDTNDNDRSSTPPFSITIFHKSLVNLIVADDQLLCVVECKEF
ncbi:hypothetical protein EDC04DRAFT_2614954 [Pisolithus marmoratus]|nr:hypothetical protein EDC04DRAFT_2614954 [Pisolithus marmoratus]